MSRWRKLSVSAALTALGVTAPALLFAGCGASFDDDVAAANAQIIDSLLDLPGAERVAVENYGYDLGDAREADEFFTEVEFQADDVELSKVVGAVHERLGDDWEVAAVDGDGDAAVATFKNGDARVSVTTWDGGFDVTVASDGARLDGTPLAL